MNLHIEMFLIGFTGLLYELLLIRIFSVFISPFFASIFISLSLFGIGIGNALSLYLQKKSTKSRLSNLTLYYAFSFLFVYFLFYSVNYYPQFLSTIIKNFQKYQNQDNFSIISFVIQFIFILIVFIIITNPLVFNGIIYSLIISEHNEIFEKIYIYNLLGAGIASFFIYFILHYANPFMLILFSSFLIAIFYIYDCFRINSRDNKKKIWVSLIYCIILTGLILFSYNKKTIYLHFKGKSYGIPLWDEWNHISRVIVVRKEPEIHTRIPFARMSMEPSRKQYSDLILYNNNDNGSMILKFDGNLNKVQFLKSDITAFPYYILPQKSKVAILGPGGGIDIIVPVLFGHTPTAIEVNPLIVYAINHVFGDYTGHVYSLPGVKTVIEDARSYLRSNNEIFDLISMLYVHPDDFSSINGFSHIENHLLTEEAFMIYSSRLSSNGILQICGDFYKNEILRIIASCKNSVQYQTKSHFVVLETQQRIKTILFKKNGFSDKEYAIITGKAKDFNVNIIYPGENSLPPLKLLIKADSYKDFNLSYMYDITPSTDDNPFFFYFKKNKEIK
ncbi:MAG: hypothetical protein HY934_06760 [Candidatus Firestonebacteria bacterium]|nr:hypothetical protein [Candidatus Firestonebacteria bacterium]